MTTASDDVLENQERRRMSDQPGIGELGRGLNSLKDEVRELTRKVENLPEAFAGRVISRERYEADELRRGVERESLQKQVDDIDRWKNNSFKRALGIIGACAGVASTVATIMAVVLR